MQKPFLNQKPNTYLGYIQLVLIEYYCAGFISLDNQELVHLVNTQLQHKLNYKPLLHRLSYSGILSELPLILYENVKAPLHICI